MGTSLTWSLLIHGMDFLKGLCPWQHPLLPLPCLQSCQHDLCQPVNRQQHLCANSPQRHKQISLLVCQGALSYGNDQLSSILLPLKGQSCTLWASSHRSILPKQPSGRVRNHAGQMGNPKRPVELQPETTSSALGSFPRYEANNLVPGPL